MGWGPHVDDAWREIITSWLALFRSCANAGPEDGLPTPVALAAGFDAGYGRLTNLPALVKFVTAWFQESRFAYLCW